MGLFQRRAGKVATVPRATVWILAAAIALVAIVRAAAPGAQAPPAAKPSPSARIVRLDPALDAVVPLGAVVENIYEGSGRLAEGPVWTRDGGLLFSDMAANVIYRMSRDGRASVFVTRAGYDGEPPKSGPMAGSNGSPSTARDV